MDHNAGYVVVGYGLVVGSLLGYSVWLRVRLRRAERSFAEPGPSHRDG